MSEQKKHPGGRPLKFKSPEELEEKIQAYFRSIQTQARDEQGELLYDIDNKPIYIYYKPPTLASLALFLDCDTKTLRNYENKTDEENKAEFFPIINHAKQKIESFNTEAVYNRDQYKGARFMLEVHNDYTVAQKVDLKAETDININLVD